MNYLIKNSAKLLTALLLSIFVNNVHGITDIFPQLDDIVVTARRTTRLLESPISATVVLSSVDIENMHVTTLQELLNTVSSVDIIEKGTPGSQADISIRGSSNEGVIVLMDGVRLRDPQTGHFTLDIPVSLSSVERVEISNGGGSTLYGPSASGGVINIVSKKNDSGSLSDIFIGSFGSKKLSTKYSQDISDIAFNVMVTGERSDGYRKGSDLECYGMQTNGSYAKGNLSVDGFFGMNDKRFGARDFFAPYDSFEKTKTFHGGLNAGYVFNDKHMIRVRLGSRGHSDDFTLIRSNPSYYRNTHYNRNYTLATEVVNELGTMTFITGLETERLGITSGSLGNHSDYNHSLYEEVTAGIGRSYIKASMRIDDNSRNEKIVSPGIGFMTPVGENIRIRFRAEKSFRPPSYTDLYYVSPANIGDPSLKSEETISLETGLDTVLMGNTIGLTGFVNESTNVIDWIRFQKDDAWISANHGKLRTSGFEMAVAQFFAESWGYRLATSLLSQSVEDKKGSESKYALNPAIRTVTAVLHGPLLMDVHASVSIRYEKRRLYGESSPVSLNLSRRYGTMKLSLSIRNLLNEQYDELPGLEAPGRWITCGVEYNR